jgi:hypothetical protein
LKTSSKDAGNNLGASLIACYQPDRLILEGGPERGKRNEVAPKRFEATASAKSLDFRMKKTISFGG